MYRFTNHIPMYCFTDPRVSLYRPPQIALPTPRIALLVYSPHSDFRDRFLRQCRICRPTIFGGQIQDRLFRLYQPCRVGGQIGDRLLSWWANSRPFLETVSNLPTWWANLRPFLALVGKFLTELTDGLEFAHLVGKFKTAYILGGQTWTETNSLEFAHLVRFGGQNSRPSWETVSILPINKIRLENSVQS